MSQLLLSIKPVYVNSIFSGKKIYEYRKFKCRDGVKKIVFYSTSPVKLVVGEAIIERIIEGSPEEVWNLTKDFSGIDRNFFDNYFHGKEKAFAYKLSDVKKYTTPKKIEELGISKVPQSFCYIK